MPSSYVLLSLKDHRTYTGSTNALDKRLKEHNDGKVYSTRNRRPLKLVYSEEYENLYDARKRERHLKTTNGRRELKKSSNNS